MSLFSSLVPDRPELDSSLAHTPSAPDGPYVAPRVDPSAHIESLAKQQLSHRSTHQLQGRTTASAAFTPSETQWITIYMIEFYVVFLLLSWNLKFFRTLIFPAKLLTVAFHESCHAIMSTLTGGKVMSIILDPNQGGSTRMIGGWSFVSLPAGYIGSTVIGASLIFAGFDEEAAKIACIPILLDMLLIMWWARQDWFTLVNVAYMMGWMIIFFLVEQSQFLRFYILFVGVTNVMYAIWDILDDLVFQRIEASDCAHFAELYPWMPAQMWGFVWFTFAFTGLVAGVLGGLVAFKDNFAQQAIAAQTFIPTI